MNEEMEMSIEELAALAAETNDQTEDTGGDFTYEAPAAGAAVMRFISYVELGVQDGGSYEGKKKPDCKQSHFTFELYGKKHVKEVEINGVATIIANKISFKLSEKLGDKAAFKKLFNKMAQGRPEIKHFAQMLGEGFLGTVQHAKSADGKITYANLRDKDGNWYIGAPRQEIIDAVTGDTTVTLIPVPTQMTPSRLFIYDKPSAGRWKSIFIDGTREIKAADGTVTNVSKNWLQETCMSAKNFSGSPLEAFLAGLNDLPISESENPAPAGQEKAPTSTGLPAERSTPADKPVADDAATAALRELGLAA
jgi:hypothetical protein